RLLPARERHRCLSEPTCCTSAAGRLAHRPPRQPRAEAEAQGGRAQAAAASCAFARSTWRRKSSVPRVARIAANPTITFTTVSVIRIPTLKASSVERGAPPRETEAEEPTLGAGPA